jgi:hypothetical protein
MSKYHRNKIKRKINRSLNSKFGSECLIINWKNGYTEWEHPVTFRISDW